MEEFIVLLTEQWPEILKFCLYVVLYFLVFLYRIKVKKSANNMKVIVKENSGYVTNVDKELRETVDRRVTAAEEKYDAAVKMCEHVEQKLSNLEKAIRVLIGEMEVIENAELPVDEEN